MIGVAGRGSAVRRWVVFAVRKLPLEFQFAGVQLASVRSRDDVITFIFQPELGRVVAIVQQAKGKWRACLGYPTGKIEPPRIQT